MLCESYSYNFKPMKPCFCYDGSLCSRDALEFVHALYLSDLFEHVTNCYIYNHRKTYLPLEYQVEAID